MGWRERHSGVRNMPPGALRGLINIFKGFETRGSKLDVSTAEVLCGNEAAWGGGPVAEGRAAGGQRAAGGVP